MTCVEPRERNRQVESKPEVGELQVVAALGRLTQVLLFEVALHDRVGELLVVAAKTGVQSRTVFDDGCLDLVEPVCRGKSVGSRTVRARAAPCPLEESRASRGEGSPGLPQF